MMELYELLDQDKINSDYFKAKKSIDVTDKLKTQVLYMLAIYRFLHQKARYIITSLKLV